MISVIIPVYNVSEYLRKSVTSVLENTYRDFEVILVDDGSTDGSSAICDELAAKNEKVRTLHYENAGCGAARNRGIEAARGEYIAFVDSDDLVEPCYLETLMKAQEDTDADLVICGYRTLKATDTKIQKNGTVSAIEIENAQAASETSGTQGQNSAGLGSDGANRIIHSNREAQLHLNGREFVRYAVVWNKLYRRSLFDDVKFEEGRVREDEAIMHRLYACAKKIAEIPDVLYSYVVRQKSIMTSSFTRKKGEDAIKAFEERTDFYFEMQDKQLCGMAFHRLFADNLEVVRKLRKSDERKKGDVRAYKNRIKKEYLKIRGLCDFSWKKKLYYNAYFLMPRTVVALKAAKGK